MTADNKKLISIKFNFNGHEAKSDYLFSPDFFSAENTVYSPQLAKLAANLTMLSYNLPYGDIPGEACGSCNALTAMGMKNITVYSGTCAEEVDSIFACLDCEINGEPVKLAFLCFVGSHHGQWYNNFDSGTGTMHSGFAECERREYEKVSAFLDEISDGNTRIKLFICGHSRGGATAGILARHLTAEQKYAKSSDIYTYTFAAPAYSKESDTENTCGIFNFVNAEDFVGCCMPKKWGYCRFGKDIVLPNCKNTKNYSGILLAINAYYSKYNPGQVYFPFKKGPCAVNKMVDALCESVTSIDEYYNKNLLCLGEDMTLKTFFTNSLCTITAETDDPEKSKPGLMLLLKSFLLRTKSSEMIKSVADFFVLYEGIGGATNGKISKQYFSVTHDMSTYCSIVMATADILQVN